MQTQNMAANWLSFWNNDHPLYVGPQHLQAHYRQLAEALAPYCPSEGRVLDIGCGEALFAPLIAARCNTLVLCEYSTLIRQRLEDRFSHIENIHIVDGQSLPEYSDASFDLIVINSVLQYLSDEERALLFTRARSLLNHQGVLMIGDVIDPSSGFLHDTLELFRFAYGQGFLLEACFGIFRVFFSDYRKMRAKLGLKRFADHQIIDELKGQGMRAIRMPQNLGHNQHRKTFYCKII